MSASKRTWRDRRQRGKGGRTQAPVIDAFDLLPDGLDLIERELVLGKELYGVFDVGGADEVVTVKVWQGNQLQTF